MTDLWISVLFSDASARESAQILGIFDTKEAAVKRALDNYINNYGKQNGFVITNKPIVWIL